MIFREITEDDIAQIFAVRIATHENRLTRKELALLGITEDSVKRRLEGSFKGWLCEIHDGVVGFAIGDKATGELWVIAVLPEYVGEGIGSRLLRTVEAWLQDNGCDRLRLITNVDTTLKAYSFYRSHGWVDDRVINGLRYMEKKL